MVYGGVFYPEYSQVGKSYEILTVPLYVPRNKQVYKILFVFEVVVAEHAINSINNIPMDLRYALVNGGKLSPHYLPQNSLWSVACYILMGHDSQEVKQNTSQN